ncbi:MAG TPA: hypothetical protein VNH84_14060 [Candidatus Saccharimonadales bacterium]|nr:hypothetical protein [Candidatus Saccharimonadales bacterium]
MSTHGLFPGRPRPYRGGVIGRLVWAAVLVGSSLSLFAQGDFQGASHLMPFDEETIHYSKSKDTSPVARLQEKLDRGEVRLTHADRFGYLLSVLRELGVSTNSQMLVFSKTSFQRERISPKAPRAVFFNDEVYLGFVAGSPLLEVSAVDPKLGGTFYTLSQTPTDRPKFVRNDQCLECHASAKTMGVPGHLVRSFATDEQGVVDLNSGTSLVTHRTPMEERWGGWYVTGRHGPQTHRGNLIGAEAFARHEKDPNYFGNVTDLSRFFEVTAYPTPRSDIVALMVLEHQTHLHNFLTRVQYESAIALQQYGHLNYLKNVLEALVKYMLFAEETPLTAAVQGAPAFVQGFTAQGPKDGRGRSLRDFDLQTRIFKYPCSYLIYSPAFDALPEEARMKIYRRIYDVLRSKEDMPGYERLSADTRQAIFEILRETKPGLPDYWKREGETKAQQPGG